jgi:hypothetical protein
MVSNPNDVPPAFRGRRPSIPSFIGMEDEQVLKVAANALRMAQILPIGGKPRADQWAAFDAAMGELGSRAIVHALERIHEIHELEQGEQPS